jgi:hypothetical protein
MAGCTCRNKKGMTGDRRRGPGNREWEIVHGSWLMEGEKILDIRYSILENGNRETTRHTSASHDAEAADCG